MQIAKTYGAEVTGVDRGEKPDMLRSLGFDHVIDYQKKEDFTKNRQLYDLILNVKTNRSVFNYVHSLITNGRYVTVGGSIGRFLQALIFGLLKPLLAKRKC